MNPYLKFVNDSAAVVAAARDIPLGGLAPCPRQATTADAQNVLLLSPHPDDECIVGGLALRLLRSGRFRVKNVAVTQGSNKERQGPRLAELEAACNYLGFEVIQVQEGGLEKINRKGKTAMPDNWSMAVEKIAAILRRERPQVLFLPHEGDWNTTHIGTHDLAVEAMTALGPDFACCTVETEFWAPMDSPNLMLEISAAELSDMIAALSFHVGEVQRNPYHLTLPAWMQDNVRRGGELVGGQGEAAPDYVFATLYRVRKWTGGTWQNAFDGGRCLGARDDVTKLLR